MPAPPIPARFERRARALVAVAVILALVLAFPLLTPGPAAAAEANPESLRTIDVVGTGNVSGTPDVLEVVLGVEVRGETATEALTRNSELLRKVLRVLRDGGVPDDDTQTAGLSIWPVTNDDDTAVVAYSVSNTVRVTLRDLDAAGSLIDAASKLADEGIVVRSLSFSFDDNSQLVARARAEAVRRAKGQAEQLADAAGVGLGRLLLIDEVSAPSGPVFRAGDAAGLAEESVPIEPGSESLSVQVRLRYEIA